MSAAPSFVPAVDSVLLVRQAIEMAGARVGRDGVLIVPASRMEERPAAATVSTGIAALDELSGGIQRGALTEICGPASSGRTSVLLSLMARMTQANEVCALVDASDSFDPQSAEAAGVELKRVMWVRCSEEASGTRRQASGSLAITKSTRHTDFRMFRFPDDQITKFPAVRRRVEISRVEQALKATDLLLQGGGFGLVVVDLAGIAPDAARRVPLTSWFRFRRTVENTATALVVLEQQPYAKTCASLVIQLAAVSSQLSVNRPTKQPSHAALFGGLEIHAEVTRDRQQRKPVQSVAAWETKTEFAI
jgi:energy-coupling factor transporter ATP-binding protein EcfA2